MLTPPLPTTTTSLTPPLLMVSNQLYLLNMRTGPLQCSAGTSALHAKELVPSWQEATAAKWETASSLSSCYRWMAVLTDRRNKLAGISRRDKLTFQGVSAFFFLFSSFCSCSFSVKVHFYSNAGRGWERPLPWCTCFVKVIQCKAKHLPVSVACVYKSLHAHCITGLWWGAEWISTKETAWMHVSLWTINCGLMQKWIILNCVRKAALTSN